MTNKKTTDKFTEKKSFTRRTKLVGVLNLTPDSFYDGGKFFDEQKAVEQLELMMNQGAEMIDIGAESSRPRSDVLSADEEWKRLEKFLPKIVAATQAFNQKNQRKVVLSLDSYHYENLIKAWELGVEIVNDISGLVDNRLIDFIAKNNVTAIMMHNLGIHANPDLIVNKDFDVIQEVVSWTERKLEILTEFGVKKSQLIFDPGVGFSKNKVQSLKILKNIKKFSCLGLPIFVGHSQKSCLDELKIKESWLKNKKMPEFELNQNSREFKTLAVSQFLIKNEVDYLRVHDIFSHKKLLLS